jgi:NAD(P)-dependent dehydrogenase (short-subunit alcohol dehydrogenase family)
MKHSIQSTTIDRQGQAALGDCRAGNGGRARGNRRRCASRSAADCGAMRGRMAGSDPDDPTAVLDPVPSHFAGLTRGFRGLRIGVAADGVGEYRRLDVTQEDGWTVLAVDVEATYGHIDILCNIAGIASGIDAATGTKTSMTLPGLSLDSWNQVMAVNAAGVFLGTKAVYPAMKRAGGGSIVNISSICGIVGSFGNAAYNASKGAVRIFSKSAALQYAKDLIRVNSVHPGFVDTPLARPGLLGNMSGKARMDATPLGRFGKPSDIALGCLYLASDDAAWVTGSELVIDGSMTAN